MAWGWVNYEIIYHILGELFLLTDFKTCWILYTFFNDQMMKMIKLYKTYFDEFK